MRKEMEGRKEPSPSELPELAGEEDGALIVFLAVATWHGTTPPHHGFALPLHYHPNYTTTTVSPDVTLLCSPSWTRHGCVTVFSLLEEPKASPFTVVIHYTHTHTYMSHGQALLSHWC